MDTVEQLLFRESEETGENICNPCFTQLTPWKDHVKVAIIVARQEALDLAKAARPSRARSSRSSSLVTTRGPWEERVAAAASDKNAATRKRDRKRAPAARRISAPRTLERARRLRQRPGRR